MNVQALDLRQELNLVRSELEALSSRLDAVDQNLTLVQELPQPAEGLPCPSERTPDLVSRDETRQESKVIKVSPVDRSTAARVPHKAVEAVLEQKLHSTGKNDQSLELQIGKYWLNRIGIGSLVLGVVFLILYSFQYFGIVAKLSVGYLISAVLIFGGEKISRQTERDWYGNTIIGGGWSLAYFTAYAMHFIPDLRILHSFSLELLALCGIAAGAMSHAVHKKSESLALIATLFGILSIALGPQSPLSFLGYLAISGSAAFIAVSNDWIKLFYVSLIASCTAHCYASGKLLGASPFNVAHSAWSIASLFAGWSLFNAALAYFAEDHMARNDNSVIFTWLNAIYLMAGISMFAQGALIGYTYWFYSGAAICYLLSDKFLSQRNLKVLADTHIFFGLVFLNTAFSAKLDGAVRASTFIIETAVLSTLYVKHKRDIFGWFAPTLLFFTYLKWITDAFILNYGEGLWLGLKSLPMAGTGLLAVLVCVAMFKKLKQATDLASNLDKSKSDKYHGPYLFEVYVLLGNIFAASLPVLIDSLEIRMTYWAILACANGFVFMRKRIQIFQLVTHMLLFLVSATSVVQINNEVTPLCFLTCGLLFCFDWLTASATKQSSSYRWFAHAANVVALMLVYQAPPQLISVALGGLGLTSLLLGFSSATVAYRGWGLASLGLLTCRLLFVDLAHANTIERILSFTVAGAVLLAGSYAYAKFAERKVV